MALPVGLLIAGYGISALSKLLASDAQADAMLTDAANNRERAVRILEQNEFNVQMVKRKRVSLIGEQKAGAVSMGVSAASGSVSNLVSESYRLIDEQIKFSTKQAELESSFAMSEAANLEEQSGKVRTAGALGAIGDVIGLASRFK